MFRSGATTFGLSMGKMPCIVPADLLTLGGNLHIELNSGTLNLSGSTRDVKYVHSFFTLFDLFLVKKMQSRY